MIYRKLIPNKHNVWSVYIIPLFGITCLGDICWIRLGWLFWEINIAITKKADKKENA